MLTRGDLLKKFARCAATWERAYEHSGSEALGEAYVVFLNPRLFNDREFWKILGLGDSVWDQILKRAFSLSTLLCFGEAGWSVVQLSSVHEIFAAKGYLMVELQGGNVLPLGSWNSASSVERINDTCSVNDLTFDHVIPLKDFMRERDRPGLRWLSKIVWETAVAESGEKDPRRGEWCRGKHGKRYHPKEWLGAKKLKKPVITKLRQYPLAKGGPHLQLQSELVEVFSHSTELMIRSANSSRGARKR